MTFDKKKQEKANKDKLEFEQTHAKEIGLCMSWFNQNPNVEDSDLLRTGITQEIIDYVRSGFMFPSDEMRAFLTESYSEIEGYLNYYLDAPKDSIQLLALWILSSHFYKSFPTFPILYLNAMRGSGKTRCLNLISHLGKGFPSKVHTSMTESVLFHEGDIVLCIDELEPKATERTNLNLLLNSCYKRGSKVPRMVKKKTKDGERYVKEEHELFKPVSLANIDGIDGVLQDRALIVYLEKSFDQIKTSRLEDFDSRLLEFKQIFSDRVTGVTGVTDMTDIINGWNNYLDSYIPKSASHLSPVTFTDDKEENPTCHPVFNVSQLKIYPEIYKRKIMGRTLEITFPLIIIASYLDDKIFESTLDLFAKIAKQRRQSDLDDKHILILRFISSLSALQETYTAFELFNRFQLEFSGVDLGLNAVSFSKALDRLGIVKKRDRSNSQRVIYLDISKAKQRIGLFDREAER